LFEAVLPEIIPLDLTSCEIAEKQPVHFRFLEAAGRH
jgi:hypothetical protein